MSSGSIVILCYLFLFVETPQVKSINFTRVVYLGHILRGGERQERGQGLLRDQQGDRRDLHKSNVRSRKAGRVRPRGGSQRWSAFRATQQQRPS